MNSILITSKNKKELKLLSDLLKKLKVNSKLLTDDQTEDMGLAILMREANRTKKVSRKTVMKKLRSK
ncbi:MAG: hypothetical protein ACRDFC_08620 [Ignavibacteria bacterium]